MLRVGEIIDSKYRIVRLIGEGGMGAVYEGENTRIHRRVAIKVLHPAQSAHAESVARFEREAQAAGRIGSEHIVEVLDLGTLPGGDRYLVMEYLEGESLNDRISRFTRLSPEQATRITLQLLEALAAAHGANIVHRDLKPDNVYLLSRSRGQADFVKLLDFGISKFNQLSGDAGFSMTRTGAVMGTPYYMAPEQAKGAREIDHRVDIYAVGVILYESVTGEVPFQADTFNELLFKIALEQPRPLEELVPGLDPNFIAIVMRAMSREPKDRYGSAAEFQEMLAAWLQGGGRASIPASADVSRISAFPAGVSAARISAPGNGSRTAGAWENTGDARKRPATGLMAALAIAALLVVGGAVAAFKHFGASSAEDASNPHASSSAEGRAPASPAMAAPSAPPPPNPAPTLDPTPAQAVSPSQTQPARARAPSPNVRAVAQPKRTSVAKPSAGTRASSSPTSQPVSPSNPSARKYRTTL